MGIGSKLWLLCFKDPKNILLTDLMRRSLFVCPSKSHGLFGQWMVLWLRREEKGHPEVSGPFGWRGVGNTTSGLGHQVASLAGLEVQLSPGSQMPWVFCSSFRPNTAPFHTQANPFPKRTHQTPVNTGAVGPPQPSSPNTCVCPQLWPERCLISPSLVTAPALLFPSEPAARQDEPGHYGRGQERVFLALA